MTAELTKSVEGALAAFNEYKGMVDGLKTKLTDITPKLDAFDIGKLTNLEKSIGDAVEVSQKAAATQKALEEQQKDQHKTFEAQIRALETAISRPAAGGSKDDAKELSAKHCKLFNDFARVKSSSQEDFEEFARKTVSDQAEFKALTVNSDPNGGYLTTPTLGGIVKTKVYESSPIRQLASVITIGSDTYEVMLDNDQASAGWVGETQARPETSTPTIGKLSIPVNELYAQPKASQKLLDDATVDVEAWLADKVSDIFARTEATAFVSGNGVMKPKGLLSYTAGTDVTQQQIEQIVSGSGTAFTYAGLVNLQSALKEPYQNNARFLLQRGSIANVMTIVDTQGHPIFNLMFDKNIGLEPTIMGRPAMFAADMPTIASNSLSLAYGDIKAAYQIVDRAGIRVLRDPFSAKPYILFYSTKRTGGAVINFEAVKLQKIST